MKPFDPTEFTRFLRSNHRVFVFYSGRTSLAVAGKPESYVSARCKAEKLCHALSEETGKTWQTLDMAVKACGLQVDNKDVHSASRIWATESRGNAAYTVLGMVLRENNVWTRVEKDVLNKNSNINIVIRIEPLTRGEQVLMDKYRNRFLI
jgi:hypothetical protein